MYVLCPGGSLKVFVIWSLGANIQSYLILPITTPFVASQSCVEENLFEHYRHLEQELKNILVRNLLDTHILLLSLTNGTNHLHETIVHTTISQTTISTAQSKYLLNFKR